MARRFNIESRADSERERQDLAVGLLATAPAAFVLLFWPRWNMLAR